MNLSCLFAPGGCLNDVVSSWIAVVPFGITGVAFIAGLVIGAILGKWGVAALIALGVALKVASNSTDDHEHVGGKDAAPPVRKPDPGKRKSGMLGRLGE